MWSWLKRLPLFEGLSSPDHPLSSLLHQAQSLVQGPGSLEFEQTVSDLCFHREWVCQDLQ